jgi:hypothetical protein
MCHVSCVLCNAVQSSQIRNTYTQRVSLIGHLFTQVLPVPLPCDSREAKSGMCFWAGEAMKHETQVEVLQDIRLLARHLATAW